jgi:hypothetical protein
MERHKQSITGVVAATLICLLSRAAAVTSAVGAQSLPPPRCDGSREAVKRDETSLRETIRESLVFLFTDRERGLDVAALERIASTIRIESIGPGIVVPAPPDDASLRSSPRVPAADTPPPLTDWVGVNPATCNQFRIHIPVLTRRILAARATDKGLARANPARTFTWTTYSDRAIG